MTQPPDAGPGAEEAIPAARSPAGRRPRRSPAALGTPRRRTHPLHSPGGLRALPGCPGRRLRGVRLRQPARPRRQPGWAAGAGAHPRRLRGPDAGLAGLQLPGLDPHGVLLRRVRRLPARLRGAAAQRAPRDPVAPAERRHDPPAARSGRGAVPGAHRGGGRRATRGSCSPTSPTPRRRPCGPRSSPVPRGCPRTWGRPPRPSSPTVPTGDLVVSLLLRSETMVLFAISLLVVRDRHGDRGPAGLLLILVTGGLPLLAVFGQFTRFFGFTVADSPDGLRLRHGLVNVQSQTVPPGRVQAIEISEPLLWRRKGWVRVSLNVAGTPGRRERPAASTCSFRWRRTRWPARSSRGSCPAWTPARMDFLPAPDRARRRALAAVQEPRSRSRRAGAGSPSRLPHPPGRGDPARPNAVGGGHPGPVAAPARAGVGAGGFDPRAGVDRRPAPVGGRGPPDRRGAAGASRRRSCDRARRSLDDRTSGAAAGDPLGFR